MYFQPIKNDDPKFDFYTMYKRETTEYDTEYIQKYNEDLNTTLIFVRFCNDLTAAVLTPFLGRSILRGQLRLRHRRPIQTRTRPRRAVRSIPPSDPPQPQPFHSPRRDSRRSSDLEWSTPRNHHNLGSPIRKPIDVDVGRIRRDVGQAVA